MPGRQYLFRQMLKGNGDAKIEVSINTLKYRIRPDSLQHVAARKLYRGDFGYCNISLDKPVVFLPYGQDRTAGSFTLFEGGGDEPVAIGIIRHELRRATNIKWQRLQVGKVERARSKGQKPCVLWFTGLSGSGKSTVAALVDKKLHAMGRHSYMLDGDNVRHGLCRDLGFTIEDRIENMRRMAETARLLVEAGLIVLVSLISPFRSERRVVRERFEPAEFMEIFVDTPLEVCEARDVKGLYRRCGGGNLRILRVLIHPMSHQQMQKSFWMVKIQHLSIWPIS